MKRIMKLKIKARLGEYSRTASDVFFILKVVFRASPSYIVFKSISALTDSLMLVVGVYFTKLLFEIFEREGAGMTDVLRLVIPYLLLTVAQSLYNQFAWSILYNTTTEKLKFSMQQELYKKAQQLDLSCYDDPEFFNTFVFAMKTADTEAIATVDRVVNLVKNIISIIGIIGIILTVSPFILLIIILSVIASMVFRLIDAKLYRRQETEQNPLVRRSDYSLRVFYLSDYAKEVRISGIGRGVLDDYEASVDGQAKVLRRFAKKWIALGTTQSVTMSLLGDAAIPLILIYSVVEGNISIGTYAAAGVAASSISNNLRQIFDTFPDFVKDSLYIERYRTFIDYKNDIVSGSLPLPSFESLTVRNLNFAYKTNDSNTLSNLSFGIKRGEKIALVGYNGAGKTTLIKLLMRLYDADSGEILYNGRDIKEYCLSEYRHNFGAVFQDYRIFALTVAENVLGGEYTPESEETVLSALHRATFDSKLSELSDGIMTRLTREFDDEGVNLSGGEEQKIAIARAFARDCDIIIMDEPSSALDPVAEYEMNHSIREGAADKTVIFISHRLSTTRMADKIYMFENGQIIEQGSHSELMKQNGKYAYMFNLQAEKYRD